MISDRPKPSPKTRQIPLRLLLIVPFVLQIMGAVALVGYLSYRSGETAVNKLADQVIDQATYRIQDHLNILIETQQEILKITDQQIQRGEIDVTNFKQLQNYFWQLMKVSPYMGGIDFINEKGEEIAYIRIAGEEEV
jgi:hypothetical protein